MVFFYVNKLSEKAYLPCDAYYICSLAGPRKKKLCTKTTNKQTKKKKQKKKKQDPPQKKQSKINAISQISSFSVFILNKIPVTCTVCKSSIYGGQF